MSRLIFDQSERVGQWVAGQVEHTPTWGEFYAMGAENDSGELVAGIVLNNYNSSNAMGHITIAKPGKYMIDLFRSFFVYTFEHCKLKRVTAGVPSTHHKMMKLAKHIGFEEEFVMKDGAPGGDMHLLVMRPENCSWLKRN